MSDFDKEAERERLREKYERDQQKREASERMSDLLLKGATMTNSHCGNCGDPIFRYDGDEFCPTCQQVVTDDQAGDEAAEGGAEDDQQGDEAVGAGSTGLDETGADAENGDAPDHIEIKQPDGPAVRTGTDQPDEPGEPESGAGADASGANPANADKNDADATDGNATETNTTASNGAPQSTPSTGTASSPSTRRPPSAQQSPAERSTAAGDAGDDFGAARASLVRTLRTHAERAEHCDDPRRARDHLTAAREAAEALSALSGSY